MKDQVNNCGAVLEVVVVNEEEGRVEDSREKIIFLLLFPQLGPPFFVNGQRT